MTRRTLALGAAFLLTLAGVATAGDGPNERHRAHRGPPPISHLAEDLDLTPAQVEALEAQHSTHREEAEALHETLREQHDALRAAMHNGTPDAATLHALVDELGALRLELDHHRVDARLATRALLTAEQQERFDALGPPPGGRHHGPPPRHHRGPPSDCPPE